MQAQPASRWQVSQASSGVHADQTSFLTAPEAAYTVTASGERAFKSKVVEDYHPLRPIGPTEVLSFPVPNYPVDPKGDRFATVHLGGKPDGSENSLHSHVLQRLKVVARFPAVVHEFGQHLFPTLGGGAGNDHRGFDQNDLDQHQQPWLSRVNAMGALMAKRITLVGPGGKVLHDSPAEFVMLRKYAKQQENSCAELIGRRPMLSESGSLQEESASDIEFVYDADMWFSRNANVRFPICLLPQGVDVRIEWRAFEDLFMTTDDGELGTPRPFVVDAQTRRIRPIESRDIEMTLEVHCNRIDDAQIAHLRARASGPHGLNYKVVQPLLLGEQVVLLQNDPSLPPELMKRYGHQAHDLPPTPASVHTSGNFEHVDATMQERTHDIRLRPCPGINRGHVFTYQQLEHRARKNWLMYSGPIVDQSDINLPARIDPIEACGLLIDGKPLRGRLLSADRARTEEWADHSLLAQRVHPLNHEYAELYADEWDGHDFDVGLPYVPGENRDWRFVRGVGTTSGVARVWGMIEDKITFSISPQGLASVRSSFVYV